MISVIGIYIQGLMDGEYTIHEACNAEDIKEMPSEYRGTLNVNGKLRKHINRYLINAEIDVTAFFHATYLSKSIRKT